LCQLEQRHERAASGFALSRCRSRRRSRNRLDDFHRHCWAITYVDATPLFVDIDGELRWVNPTSTLNSLLVSSLFINNAVYVTHGSTLNRVDLDGADTVLADFSNRGVVNFHHNIDAGKTGMLMEAGTTGYYESVITEVDFSGALLRTWNIASIIRAAMIAGGDDPSQFVFPTPNDWFHNNAVT
jgi:arylsulfate sulfotransferase